MSTAFYIYHLHPLSSVLQSIRLEKTKEFTAITLWLLSSVKINEKQKYMAHEIGPYFCWVSLPSSPPPSPNRDQGFLILWLFPSKRHIVISFLKGMEYFSMTIEPAAFLTDNFSNLISRYIHAQVHEFSNLQFLNINNVDMNIHIFFSIVVG